MENMENSSPRTVMTSWKAVSISFVLWFFVPLGIDKLLDSMRTADYGRLVGTLVVACIATYFVPITPAKRGK